MLNLLILLQNPIVKLFEKKHGWWLKLNRLNSLVVLGAWMLWKHHNDCLFNGSSPNVLQTLRFVLRESDLWSLAGARGLAPA
jgi:hypothetical protein